jgi:hypothetical protein
MPKCFAWMAQAENGLYFGNNLAVERVLSLQQIQKVTRN